MVNFKRKILRENNLFYKRLYSVKTLRNINMDESIYKEFWKALYRKNPFGSSWIYTLLLYHSDWPVGEHLTQWGPEFLIFSIRFWRTDPFHLLKSCKCISLQATSTYVHVKKARLQKIRKLSERSRNEFRDRKQKYI